jgi:hypothetical protein
MFARDSHCEFDSKSFVATAARVSRRVLARIHAFSGRARDVARAGWARRISIFYLGLAAR